VSDRRSVIVGAAETERIGVVPDVSALEMHVESARLSPIAVAHYLGIAPTYVDATSVGGCSFLLHVRHAAAAIASGRCEVVLITHGESGRSRVGAPPRVMDPASPQGQFEAPYGISGPPTLFPIGVLRYMKEFGLTHEQLASVPVAQRRWSAYVPRAMYREPLTVDDVLASPMIAYPMHLLECCVVTDGGGALVVTSAERA
jgi:acetyl-CoA acetyltransferase